MKLNRNQETVGGAHFWVDAGAKFWLDAGGPGGAGRDHCRQLPPLSWADTITNWSKEIQEKRFRENSWGRYIVKNIAN